MIEENRHTDRQDGKDESKMHFLFAFMRKILKNDSEDYARYGSFWEMDSEQKRAQSKQKVYQKIAKQKASRKSSNQRNTNPSLCGEKH